MSIAPEDLFSMTACQRMLDQAVWLLDECETVLTKQVAVRRSASVSGSKETPMPLDMGASVLLSDMAAWARSWAGLVCDELGTIAPYDPQDALRCLRRAVLHVAESAYAEEFQDELTERVTAMVKLVDLPENRILIGMCWSCQTAVFAKPSAQEAKCSNCGVIHNVMTLKERTVERALDVHVTAPAAAKLLNTLVGQFSASIVSTWANRGRLQSTGKNLNGVAMYRFGDVMELAVQKVSRMS